MVTLPSQIPRHNSAFVGFILLNGSCGISLISFSCSETMGMDFNFFSGANIRIGDGSGLVRLLWISSPSVTNTWRNWVVTRIPTEINSLASPIPAII
jgi:hypothetical protein